MRTPVRNHRRSRSSFRVALEVQGYNLVQTPVLEMVACHGGGLNSVSLYNGSNPVRQGFALRLFYQKLHLLMLSVRALGFQSTNFAGCTFRSSKRVCSWQVSHGSHSKSIKQELEGHRLCASSCVSHAIVFPCNCVLTGLASTPNHDRMEGEGTGIGKLIPTEPAWCVKPLR